LFLIIDYFSPTPCPGSPTLPDKHSTLITATLSPPGAPLTASATSLASSSKRRGLGLTGSGHRASYKRAHTGRLVSITNRNYSMKINKTEY
jgi:hypothetical protein